MNSNEKLQAENLKLKKEIEQSNKNIERIFFFLAIGVGFYFYGFIGAIIGLLVSYFTFGIKK